jgi:hypothetical protein
MCALYDETNGRRYTWKRIGSGVKWKQHYRTQEPSDWIFKTYIDGTAVFYPHKLGRFNWGTADKIKAMIYKYYYVVNSIDLDTGYNHKKVVLRRKSITSETSHTQHENFTTHLLTKYNVGANDE